MRKRYIGLVLLLSYIVFSQSCMTMRSTPRETKTFFEKAKVSFIDSTVSISGNPIHYIETGKPDLPTLVFVHGSPGSCDAFQNYLKDSLLLEKYRMISVDRPGFGYSDFGKAEDLQTQSRILTSFIEKTANGKPIVLVGHSLGGPIIAKLATQNPDWYKHLVILSGSLDPMAENREEWRYYIKIKPIRYLIPGALRPSNDELWYLKKDLQDLRPELKKITSGVTIIHGTNDQLVPFSNVAFMKTQMPNAKTMSVTAIIDANHFIPWENFELIRKTLLDLRL